MYRTFAAPALLAALALAPTAAPAAAPHARSAAGQARAEATVTLKDIAFHPPRVTIRRGGTVHFRWEDGRTQHNVTSTGQRRFKPSTTKRSGTYAVRLRTAGTYRYLCTIHFGMKGTIVVK